MHSYQQDASPGDGGAHYTQQQDLNPPPGGDIEWDPEALGQQLLNDESHSDWSAVTNLDAFFCKVYTYYVEKGFWCMIAARLTNLLTLAFTICFSSFLLLFVNWHSLVFCDNNCDEVVGWRSSVFTSPTTGDVVVFIYFGVFCVYWLWNLLSFFYSLRDAYEMYSFYKDDLDIRDEDLVSLEWHYILESLVQVSAKKKLCIVKDLTALDITNRILRKENYMIAMINLDLFQFGPFDAEGRWNVTPKWCCPSGGKGGGERKRQGVVMRGGGQEMKETGPAAATGRKVLRERPKPSSAAISATANSNAKALKNPLLDQSGQVSVQVNSSSSAAAGTSNATASSYSTFTSPTAGAASSPHATRFIPSDSSTHPKNSWWSWAIMGTTLEWNIRFCVLHSLFDHHFYVHSSNLGSAGIQALKRRFRIVGLANLILSPFIMLFMIIFFFLKHAEELHSKKTLFGPRQWNFLSQWKLREFNELQHFFERRLTLSSVAAQQYMQQFPNTLASIIAQSIAYITGALVAILLLLTVTDSDIISHRIYDRTLLWWLAIFSGILALSRSMIPDKTIYPAPALVMGEVIKHTHYSPLHWKHRWHTSEVHKEFSYMYPSRLSMFGFEILSVIMTPFVLIFCLPKSAERIVQFVSTRTVNVQGVGHLCAFAMFDLEKHGDTRYSLLGGIPTSTPSLSQQVSGESKAGEQKSGAIPRQTSTGSNGGGAGVAPFPLRLKNGKLEKSFLGFSMANPHWKPAAGEDGGSGRRFLEGLAETMYGGGGGGSTIVSPMALSREVSSDPQMKKLRASTVRFAPSAANATAAAASSNKLPSQSTYISRQDSLDSNTTEEEDGFDVEEAEEDGHQAGDEGDDTSAGRTRGARKQQQQQSGSFMLSQSDRHLIQSFADLVGMDPSMQSTLHPSSLMRQSSLTSTIGGGGGGAVGANSTLGMSTMLGLNSRRPHSSPQRPENPPMHQSMMMRSQMGFQGGLGAGGSLYHPTNSVLLQSGMLGPAAGAGNRFGGGGTGMLQGGLSASTMLHMDAQAVREGLMLSQADQQADLFALLESRLDQEIPQIDETDEEQHADGGPDGGSSSEPEPEPEPFTSHTPAYPSHAQSVPRTFAEPLLPHSHAQSQLLSSPPHQQLQQLPMKPSSFDARQYATSATPPENAFLHSAVQQQQQQPPYQQAQAQPHPSEAADDNEPPPMSFFN